MKKSKSTIVLFFLIFILAWPTGCFNGDQARARTTTTAERNEIDEGETTPQDNDERIVEEMTLTRGLGHSYDMDLTLDVDARKIGGIVSVEILNDSEDEWHNLCFRDYSSVFSSHTLHGESEQRVILMEGARTKIDYFNNDQGEALSFSRDEQDMSVVYVELDEAISPGERRIITYSFSATVPIVADRYGTTDGYFNLTHFYPILAVYDEVEGWSTSPYISMSESFFNIISDYSVQIRVPADYTVISSGVVAEVLENTDEDIWMIDAPCIRDFALVVGSEFNMLSESVDGILVKVYYMDDDVVFGQHMLMAAIDSMKAFNEAFGKYPYPEVNVIQTPLFAGGMEYTNLVMIGPEMLMQYDDSEYDDSEYDSYYWVRLVTAHEVGHQWFYAIVGNDPYNEPWLDEAFASFSEFVYLEAIGRQRTVIDDVNWIRLSRYAYPINLAYFEYPDLWQFYDTVYRVGAVMLFELRNAMGGNIFYDMMRTYVARHAFENVTQEDFLNVVYEFSGFDNESVNKVLSIYLHVDPPISEALEPAA